MPGPLYKSDGPKSVRDDTHEFTTLRTLGFEQDFARRFREQSVVTTETDVTACMETRATLAHEDIAREDLFSTVTLYAQPF